MKLLHLWHRWVRFLGHREPATGLALFRISLGLLILHTMGSIVLSDVVVPLWANIDEGGIRNLSDRNWLVEQLGGPGLETSKLLLGSTILASTLLTLGIASRLSALVALQTCLALWSLHPTSGGGHDRLINNALWILVLAPSGQTLSVWCRLKTGQWWNDQPVMAWPRYLGVFQIALVYTTTGLQKLGAEWFPWGDYQAIYLSLLQPSWARFETPWIAWFFPFTQLGTVVTWVWESTWMLVPLALYFRHTRTQPGRLRAVCNRLDIRSIYVVVGVVLHAGIFALMNVGPFSWITSTFYFCAWHHDEYRAGWRRFRTWRTRLGGAPATD